MSDDRADREAMREILSEGPGDPHYLPDFLLANRDAVLRALGAKPVYASQEWVDADGVRSGWRTGYGYYTRSHEDAKRHLDWDRDNFDGEQFRLAAAWLTEWEDYTDE